MTTRRTLPSSVGNSLTDLFVFNQLVPEDDFPIPPVKDDDDDDDDDDESPSNSFWRPLPRPFLMDIADRFVVMHIGANAVATHTTIASTSSEEDRVIFIVIICSWRIGRVDC
jgi:hypothetical protein